MPCSLIEAKAPRCCAPLHNPWRNQPHEGAVAVAATVDRVCRPGGYNWDTIALGWGFAVVMGVYVAGGITGAHINPAIGLSVGGPTGYAINPARDFGPRLFAALVAGDTAAFSGWYFVVPIVGPLIGGVAGAWFYDVLVKPCLPRKVEPHPEPIGADTGPARVTSHAA
jgi:glycerol uptake facilitator-like aquaporin